MQKNAQPLSPRTQAFAAPAPTGDEAQSMFEEGFSQMAYNVVVSKFPDLMQEIVTFKILDSDVEHGAGVGAFVLQHNNEVLYIPVIMADNQIKPIDLFYHKQLNMFLPLNNDWLAEISQLSLDEMGETVQIPKSLRRDVDTRHIMIPPTTGNRYGYAAAGAQKIELLDDLHQMMVHAQEKTAQAPLLFVKTLAQAPESVKEAFVQVLKKRPHLVFQIEKMYGSDAFYSALSKTASATSQSGGGLFIATKDTPPTTFKKIFGDRQAEAFQGALRKGYAARDNRVNLNIPVQIQEQMVLQTPAESGFYRVYTRDGDVKPAFILHNPRQIHSALGRDYGGYRKERRDDLHYGQHHKDYIVIMDDGVWLRVRSDLTAQPLKVPSEAAAFGKLCNGKNGDQPQVGDRGLFIKKLGKTFSGTEPFTIKSIATDSKGVRRITCRDFNDTVLVTDPAAAKAGLHQPKNSNIMYIPPDARFLRLKDDYEPQVTLLKDSSSVARWFYNKFDALGANSLTIKNAGAYQYSINGKTPQSFLDTVREAAVSYKIPFDSAEALVKQAAAPLQRRSMAYVLTPAMYQKIAQMPMMDAATDPAVAGGMPQGAPMDPSMAGMPPAPPSPPSPLDIAMGEAQTQIQQQTMDLEQQNMALQDKAQTLMMVQQRAQEIAGGGSAAVQQGAPPMPPPGMGGGAPAGGPAMGGGAPPAGPGAMGGGMPAPAPQMSGGGMEAMGQSPMGAVMSTESPSSAEMPQQINPQFLEQAGGLEDAGAFDAAALATMAQSPGFRDMVVDYVPTLERALDNLGRTLLTLWIQEREIKEQLGDETFGDMEDNLRAVFEGLGKLILQMNRNAILTEMPNK